MLICLKHDGFGIAMVTGKGRYSTGISLKHFNRTHLFAVIETGSPPRPGKPEGIRLVLNVFKDFKKEEVIYVGDVPGDILAGRNVGIPVVAAAWTETAEPGKLMEVHPDQLFYSIPDFTHWLYQKTGSRKQEFKLGAINCLLWKDCYLLAAIPSKMFFKSMHHS